MATSAPATQTATSGKSTTTAKSFRMGTQPTVQSFGYNPSLTMTTATQPFPTWQLPANNILRCIFLEVSAVTSGNEATVAFNTPDAPLNVLQTVNFQDSTTTSIVGTFDSYTLGVVQKYGGYTFSSDVRSNATYTATTGSGSTAGSFNIVFRIPVEIVPRTGFGSLSNTSSNAPFQLQLTLNSSTAVYSTAPTSLPVVTVTASLGGYWAGPASSAAPEPLNYGTTSRWQRNSLTGLDGSQTQVLPPNGLGAMHRNWVYMNYATGGSRSDADFPTSLQVQFRGNILRQQDQNLWKSQMSQDYGLTGSLDAANGLDTGVYVIPFSQDFGLQPGDDAMTGWLSTEIGDSITLIGSWGASSTLYNLVNYVVLDNPAGAGAGA